MPLKTTPGRLIKAALVAAEMNQSELARLMETDPSLVSRYVRDEAGIEPSTYDALLRALPGHLSAAELAAAIGYRVPVSTEDRLPTGFVNTLAKLDDEGRGLIPRLAQKLLGPQGE